MQIVSLPGTTAKACSIRQTPMHKTACLLMGVAVFLAAAEEPVRPSPPLSMERLHSAPLTLSQYRGKVVALAFIYTSCSHCQELTQVLNRLAAEYDFRGVQFLECAFNGDAATAMREFLERYKPPFPVGWTSDSVVRSYLRYPISEKRMLYVPHMIFLDRQGIIRGDFAGESSFFTNAESSIRGELERLLKPSSPKAATAGGASR